MKYTHLLKACFLLLVVVVIYVPKRLYNANVVIFFSVGVVVVVGLICSMLSTLILTKNN